MALDREADMFLGAGRWLLNLCSLPLAAVIVLLWRIAA
jgi:hypothetical protein